MFPSYLISFIQVFSKLLIFAIFVRILLSWMRAERNGRLAQLIYDATEPILGFFRNLVPPIGGMLDLSPILAYFSIIFVSDIIIRILISL